MCFSHARVLSYVLPPRESAKTRETKAIANDWMLFQKCTRDTCVIVLGGGVIGDMCDSVLKATLMRGVPFVQIPTTLLAMVDSSIGGKTAVDTPHGKNLNYLPTLPRREFVNGLAENPESVDSLLRVILGSAALKSHIVTVDEKETGLRHSVGHWIEAILFPELLHGECVAIGMVKEAEIARHLGYLSDMSLGRLVRCLQAYGLPVSLDVKLESAAAQTRLDIMRVDKNQGDKNRLVLLATIGKIVEEKATFVSDDVIRAGSKSTWNRALVLAALGQGSSKLTGLLHSDDVQYMLVALQKIVGIDTLVFRGGAGKLRVPSSEVYLGNAATASRFLTSVFEYIEKQELPPIADYANSSQYVCSVLMAAPYAADAVPLELIGDAVVSLPYIDMTTAMMESFGIKVDREPGTNTYRIPKGVYKNPEAYLVEANASPATYPLQFAAIIGDTVVVSPEDSEFEIKEPQRMGCKVMQMAISTTVTGPHELNALSDIDMESITDATALVLAGVATRPAAVSKQKEAISRITGIANQRVKECDRIAAMVAQLGRFGVKASVLPDAVRNGVKCYDDHRVAMNNTSLRFGPLSDWRTISVVNEKKCVEKTWPSWWDTLQNILGVRVNGADDPPKKSAATDALNGHTKSQKAKLGCARFQRTFIAMDEYLEQTRKTTIPKLIEQRDSRRSARWISWGGGIFETPNALALLKEYSGRTGGKKNGHILYLRRDIDGVDVRGVWSRCRPLYEQCTNIKFKVPKMHTAAQDSWWVRVEILLARRGSILVAKVFGPTGGRRRFAPHLLPFTDSLTYSNIEDAIPVLDQLSEGVEALELRVDLLDRGEVVLLKAHTDLPIVFTVTTKGQGGAFAYDAVQKLFELLYWGVRWGCEFIDVEVTDWDTPRRELTEALIKAKGHAQIIAPYHDVSSGKVPWTVSAGATSSSMGEKYTELHRRADVVKLIGVARKPEDNFALREFCYQCSSHQTHHTHSKAATPGQLTVEEVNRIRHSIGLLPAREFFLFGEPINKSFSPLINNTSFQVLGLPYTYGLRETTEWKTLLVDASWRFGEKRMCLRTTARRIGAINTLLTGMSRDKTILFGDNTERLGSGRMH
ncbi:RNA 3'-terminal phosphate cyclase/enolpyruvate transferase [Cladochytrium replicatum]|nr:RNA 3'-terminal phosphate cyclase/enolpyruvate transferase [Cladochytrium replicatum]